MLNEKKYVKVSMCKSNVKKSTYYARVCKKGKVSEQDLINKVREKAPYIDINSLEVGLKVLSEVIVECVEAGLDVDLFGLGTIGLKGKGSVKVDDGIKEVIDGAFKKRNEGEKITSGSVAEDEQAAAPLDNAASSIHIEESSTYIEGIEGSYEKDLTSIAKKGVSFSLQFSPSKVVKHHIKEHVEPSFITVKMRQPRINSIEKVYGGDGEPCVIKIKGEDLKIAGEGGNIYIRKENDVYRLPKEAIIQNEPKTLMIITNIPLKSNEKYSIYLNTQYAKMGSRLTSIVRRCVKEFSFTKDDEKQGKPLGALSKKAA